MKSTFKLKNNAISKIIKNSNTNFSCPYCNNQFSFSLKQVGSQITCPLCQKQIELIDEGFTKAINDLDKILK